MYVSSGGIEVSKKSKSSFAFNACEDLVAVIGNQDGVLVLGRKVAILSDGGPVVFQNSEIGLAEINSLWVPHTAGLWHRCHPTVLPAEQ